MENFFAKNLKALRERNGYSQSELSRITQKICESYNQSINDDENKLSPITQASIARWEAGENSPSVDNIVLLRHALGVDLVDLIGKDLSFDNATYIEVSNDCVQIPVLGTIKAGIAIEAQQDILEYVDIPKAWLRGNKKFYGLKISGDSMYPKYNENDIVIFEQTEDYTIANNKDCAVMVNGFDATFKNVTITEAGITLVPFNLNNQDNYQPTFYSKEQVVQLPVKIVGIAREKRTRL